MNSGSNNDVLETGFAHSTSTPFLAASEGMDCLSLPPPVSPHPSQSSYTVLAGISLAIVSINLAQSKIVSIPCDFFLLSDWSNAVQATQG